MNKQKIIEMKDNHREIFRVAYAMVNRIHIFSVTDNITKIFWRFVKMMRNRGWLIAVIIGIALMTTVCYFTIQRNTRTEYTNGRII